MIIEEEKGDKQQLNQQLYGIIQKISDLNFEKKQIELQIQQQQDKEKPNAFSYLMNQNNNNSNSELEQEIKDIINLRTNNNRRKTYSEEYKQKVIGLTNKYNNVSHRTLASMLELNESQIRRWIKNGGKNKTRGSKKVISEDHDNKVYKFIIDQRDQFKKVSTRSAVLYAKKLAKELNLDLRCSSGWFQKFCKRKSICIRKITSKGSGDLQKDTQTKIKNDFILKFQQFLDDKKNMISKDHVYNFDETGIAMDDSGPSTLSIVGEKQIKVKTNNKEKFQVSFGITSTLKGKMLNCLCIWHTKGVKNQNRLQLEEGINKFMDIYYRGSKSWFGEEEMIYYINNILKPYSRTLPKGLKGIILLDGCRSHTTVRVLDAIKKINFIHYLLPPNSTSFLQPNDQQINKHIKQEYCKFWEEEFQKDMQQEDTKQQFNKFVNQIAKIVRDIPIELVKASWQMYLNPTHLQIDDPQICQVNELQNEENNNEVDNEDKLNDYGIWGSKNYECIISNEILTQDKQDENIVPFEDIHSSDTSDQESSESESGNEVEIPTTKPIINQKNTKYSIKSYFK